MFEKAKDLKNNSRIFSPIEIHTVTSNWYAKPVQIFLNKKCTP